MADEKSEAQEVTELLRQMPAELPTELFVLPTDNFVLFPFMIAPLMVADDASLRMVEEALRGQRMIAVFTRRREDAPPPEGGDDRKDGAHEEKSSRFDSLPDVGTAAAILKLLRIPDGSMRLLVHGVCRVRIAKRLSEEPHLRAAIEPLPEAAPHDPESLALMQNVKALLKEIVRLSSLPEDLAVAASNIADAGKLADLAASNLNLSATEQQRALDTVDVKERLRFVLECLTRETQVLEIGSKIQDEVKSKLDKRQRDYMLREQVKAIRHELGDDEDGNPEIAELRQAIAKAKLPEHARKAADKELSRLEVMTPAAAEYGVTRNYLDWILSLPWEASSHGKIDILRAERILDEDHYGLEKVKERILEYLAVVKLKKNLRGPILCFAGPPGVGKTSLGRSIARALGRKFFRISLGGMRDEAEIRGHRRTYIGAMPGRLIGGFKNCGTNNPVVMLDEIDKLGADFRGDPAAALLEVLDPEQNYSFTDHYLDLPFDLSKTMFITTANILDTIPSPLRDRMEVLSLPGYTQREKLEIAKRYLVPRCQKDNGVGPERLAFEDAAIERLIEDYTREAGLRNLEREIGSICRKVARRVASGEKPKVRVTREAVPGFLGASKFFIETAERASQPGVVVGLAWTPVGGEILFIEATATRGRGQMTLTGQLGEIMRESAQAARSFLHANAGRFRIPVSRFTHYDVHVHVPAGAIPKDGPSAGIALCTAMASLLKGLRVRERVAMTGEITLKGDVLPIAGLKEKVLAAHRAGIREIYLPLRNEKDLDDIPAEVRDAIKFNLVDRMEKVLATAFQPCQGPAVKRAAIESRPRTAAPKTAPKRPAAIVVKAPRPVPVRRAARSPKP